MDQLKLEQKGCVHAHMDLLKICMRLQPFVDVCLLVDVLGVALKARRLDVEASPYDGSGYGLGVVPVETREGRREYKRRQVELMEEVEPVRRRLLRAYELFLGLTFEEEYLGFLDGVNSEYAAPERFSSAQPGGLPWRQNVRQT